MIFLFYSVMLSSSTVAYFGLIYDFLQLILIYLWDVIQLLIKKLTKSRVEMENTRYCSKFNITNVGFEKTLKNMI